MNSFSHHTINRADVVIRRSRNGIRIEIEDVTPANRIVIEIDRATVRDVDLSDAALSKAVDHG